MTVSLAGVTGVGLGAGLLMVVEVVRGGRGEEKLKVGMVLMGSEMAGRSGTSAT